MNNKKCFNCVCYLVILCSKYSIACGPGGHNLKKYFNSITFNNNNVNKCNEK